MIFSVGWSKPGCLSVTRTDLLILSAFFKKLPFLVVIICFSRIKLNSPFIGNKSLISMLKYEKNSCQTRVVAIFLGAKLNGCPKRISGCLGAIELNKALSLTV